MMSRTVVIWDTAKDVTNSKYFNVMWQSYTAPILENKVSIPQLVEENDDELRSRYLSFIYDLGEVKVKKNRIIDHLKIKSNFSYWWMTLLVEKCNFLKSPQIDNIIKLMAFDKWLNNQNFTKIKIVTHNQQLAESVKILSEQLDVEFELVRLPAQRVTETIIRRIYNILPEIIKAPIMLIYYLIDRWKLKGIGVDRIKKTTSVTTFISYFFNLDIEQANHGAFKDRYWTELPDLLIKNKIKSNWLHLFVKSEFLPTTLSAKKLIKKINKLQGGAQNHLFLDSFLSVAVIRQTISDWIAILFRYRKIKLGIKKQSQYFWPLLRSDVKASLLGSVGMKNIMFYHLFKSAMKTLPNQKKGFYLLENQDWEFGFIAAWREFEHGNLTGVAHSSVRYWDLRYFFDKKIYADGNSLEFPLPDKVAVNGKVAKQQYLDGGYPADSLVEVEALRYLKLDKFNNCDKATVRSNKNINYILVLGDYLQKNTTLQMQLLHKACKQITVDVHFIIKPHPMNPISQQYCNNNKIKMTVTDKPIDELIDKVVMAYTSSVTSAAIDLYCVGKKVVTILDETTLNLSPLRGCESISFVSSPREFSNIINNISKIKDVTGQGSDFFYFDKHLTKWKKIINNN